MENIFKSKQAGISLIEIILSIALLGFIVLAVGSVPNSIRLIARTQKDSLAKDVAAKEIEQLRLQTYDNLSNGTLTINDSRLSSLPQSSGTAVISDCSISVCPNGETAKQVVVTISWMDQSDTKKVTLSTFISKGGLQ